jgi:hypothetical protein
MKILVIFPTRSRLQKAFSTLSLYHELASDNSKIKYVVSIDEDDVEMVNAKSKFEQLVNVEVIVGKCLDKIPKFDRDIHNLKYDWQIIVATADDMIPLVKGWDTIIREDMGKYFSDLDGALFYNDGVRKYTLNTLPIMGRKYFDRFKYIWYPGYKSLRCDAEYTEVGFYLGRLKYIDKVIIEHRHPTVTKEPLDYVHEQNTVNWDHDLSTYASRREKLFGLSKLEWLDKIEYAKWTSADSYWKPTRYEYLSRVVELGKQLNPMSVVELGAYGKVLCKSSATIDCKREANPTYLLDASITPWPIKRKYDLSIACQVMEHLSPNQNGAFKELCRISKDIIITVPYKWKGDSTSHNGIDEATLLKWTNAQPYHFEIIGTGNNKQRVLACYKGDKR